MEQAIFDKDYSNPNAHHLSHEMAKQRDAAIEKVHLYDLALNLFKEERYQGKLTIKATFKADPQFLDFHGE